jgi:hypothetical protein
MASVDDTWWPSLSNAAVAVDRVVPDASSCETETGLPAPS